MASAWIETWSYRKPGPNVGVVAHIDANHIRFGQNRHYDQNAEVRLAFRERTLIHLQCAPLTNRHCERTHSTRRHRIEFALS
jgi:hypothetical protein